MATEPEMIALYAALAKAIADSAAVGKAGENTFHRYKYATAEAILDEARGALARNGLSLISKAPRLARREDGQPVVLAAEITRATKDSRTRTDPYQSLLGLFAHALVHEAGGVLDLGVTEWPVCPDAGRPTDKALAATSTTVLAYTVRNLLLLPRIDHEVDQDTRGEERGRRERPNSRVLDEEEAAQAALAEGRRLVANAAREAKELGASPGRVAAWLARLAGVQLVEDGRLRLSTVGDPEVLERVLGAPRTAAGGLELPDDLLEKEELAACPGAVPTVATTPDHKSVPQDSATPDAAAGDAVGDEPSEDDDDDDDEQPVIRDAWDELVDEIAARRDDALAKDYGLAAIVARVNKLAGADVMRADGTIDEAALRSAGDVITLEHRFGLNADDRKAVAHG